MRIQDIIRNLLNVVDGKPAPSTPAIVVIQKELPGEESPLTHTGKDDDIRRFRQIVDLADDGDKEYVNSPNEQYADIDAVTKNAGGGANMPKHPQDLRGNSFPIYSRRD